RRRGPPSWRSTCVGTKAGRPNATRYNLSRLLAPERFVGFRFGFGKADTDVLQHVTVEFADTLPRAVAPPRRHDHLPRKTTARPVATSRQPLVWPNDLRRF